MSERRKIESSARGTESFLNREGSCRIADFAASLALSGATSCANRPVHAPICPYLRIVRKHYKLCGGAREIRTDGATGSSWPQIEPRIGELFGAEIVKTSAESLFAFSSADPQLSPIFGLLLSRRRNTAVAASFGCTVVPNTTGTNDKCATSTICYRKDRCQ
jgi:hypothetical protein